MDNCPAYPTRAESGASDPAAFDRRAHPADLVFSTWTAPDGWAIRRAAWPHDAARARRGSLLFASGRGDFVEKYLEALHDWQARGWDVETFDWRGQGRSKGAIASAEFEDFGPMVADLGAIVGEWLARTAGPHVLVAHSMGAHLALRVLVDLHPALDAVVLVAPMVEVNAGPLPLWLARGVADVASGIGLSRRPLTSVPLEPAPVGSLRQKILTADPDRYQDEQYWWAQDATFKPAAPSFGWIRAAFRSARAFTARALEAVTTPVLILAAPGDRLVSTAAIVRAAGLMPGARLDMVRGAAHEILRDADPARRHALASIDAFLDLHAPVPTGS